MFHKNHVAVVGAAAAAAGFRSCVRTDELTDDVVVDVSNFRSFLWLHFFPDSPIKFSRFIVFRF